MKTQPLNNNCLVEVIKEYDGVSRADENEDKSYGKLISYSVMPHHVTASSFGKFSQEHMDYIISRLNDAKNKTVRWEQYAEGGQTFVEDGKTYALVPWWRLIGVSDG